MSGPTIVVAGALANKPRNGGEAWVRLSWIRGLQRLGCDVWFVEHIDERTCTDGEGRQSRFAESDNRLWFREVTAEFGLADRSWLICDSGDVDELPNVDIGDVAENALLVNISGHMRDGWLKRAFAKRVYVDIDPGFTQIWHEHGNDGARLPGHDLYFTIGLNIGTAGCPIPTNGLPWIPIFPPVVLADWPHCPAMDVADARRFTTVGTWRGPFGPVELDRRRFGLKVHEFRKFISLPHLVDAQFEAALAIHPSEVADLDLLRTHGWHLVEPLEVAGSCDSFQKYLVNSAAEFSVAQGVYVETASGWFSDRTTRYLACGRPALVQETGFGRIVPVGKGLLSFDSLQDAVTGAESIASDYELHAAAAREVATAHFDSDIVLGRFLEQCGVR